ncbi:MAG: YceD family protein [Novosphingobium sp.]
MSEFQRLIDVRQAEGKVAKLEASETERAALATRFDLVAVKRLEAELVLSRKDRVVSASGTLSADIVQSCAISDEDLPVTIRENVAFRFVPEAAHATPDEEVELSGDELDDIEYAGSHFDLGEAVAQSMALAIDPFATGPNADEARRRAGISDETASGAFAALAALKKQD